MNVSGPLHSTENRTQKTSSFHGLRVGEWFSGKVKTIYNGQFAAIETKNSSFVARLEAALEANKRYVFQVKQTGREIQLKVVQQTGSVDVNETLGKRADRFERAIFHHFVKHEVAFTKEQNQQLATLLKEAGTVKPNALQTITLMQERQFPVTKATFDALHTFQTSSLTLSERLDTLKQQLQQSQSRSEPATRFLQLLEHVSSSRDVGNREVLQFTRLQQIVHDAVRGEGARQQGATELLSRLQWIERGTTMVQEQHARTFEQKLVHMSQKEQASAMSQLLHAKGLTKDERFVLQQLFKEERIQVSQVRDFLRGENHVSVRALLQAGVSSELPVQQKGQLATVFQQVVGTSLFHESQTQPLIVPMQVNDTFLDVLVMLDDPKEQLEATERVLFFLTLPHLKDTVVDVRRQKQQLAIAVYNQADEPHWMKPILLPPFKEKLKELGFSLTSFEWLRSNEQLPVLTSSNQEITTNHRLDVRV
ncbi:hypothetical protein DH09_04640 [Bacillaceae bacterium JMAK1]|nr:hypothetical protein DH09_04640 [Bacillaceae bacterium JMAK1]